MFAKDFHENVSIWLLYLYVHHGYTLNKFMKKNDITKWLNDIRQTTQEIQ